MKYRIKQAITLLAVVLPAVIWLPTAAFGHHGWGWASEEEFEITGRIVSVDLGNPHGELKLQVGDDEWVVEVGQPWRNERAGLSDDLLRVGQIITVHGHRSSQPADRLLKAERVIIDGRDYNLYPDRRS